MKTNISYLDVWYSYLHKIYFIIIKAFDLKLFFKDLNKIYFNYQSLFFLLPNIILLMLLDFNLLVFFILFYKLSYINI